VIGQRPGSTTAGDGAALTFTRLAERNDNRQRSADRAALPGSAGRTREKAMSSKPGIVLVHGFWGGAAHWAKVIVELNRRGYDSLHAVESPLTSLPDDAGRTQKMLRQVDGPVLLVGHSYGWAVITQAGDLPNVGGLVYVAAFAPGAVRAWPRSATGGWPRPPRPGISRPTPPAGQAAQPPRTRLLTSWCCSPRAAKSRRATRHGPGRHG